MNLKRFGLAAGGAFAAIVTGDFIIHQVWLGPVYAATPQWWRPAAEMRSLTGLMFFSEAVLAVLLTSIYTKGYEAKKGTVGQGFRFGVLLGLLLSLPSGLMEAFVYPYPATLIMSWMAGTLLEIVVAGLMIGVLYRPTAK